MGKREEIYERVSHGEMRCSFLLCGMRACAEGIKLKAEVHTVKWMIFVEKGGPE